MVSSQCMGPKMGDEHFLKQTLPFAECRYSINSGRHYKSHMHKTFSIGAIDRGEVIYQVEEKVGKLQPGSLVLINPDILHSCNPTEFCKRSYYMLNLDVGWCLKLQQSLWQLETFSPVITIILEDNSVYRQFIDTMEALMDRGDLLEKEQLLVDIVETIFLQIANEDTTRVEG